METKGAGNQMRTSSSSTGAMGRLQPWWSVCSRWVGRLAAGVPK